MVDHERRQGTPFRSSALRAQLNDDQLMTLRELEQFGWELKFIRHPPFQEPIPVVFDGERKSFSVLKADGTLEERPDIRIRG